MPKRLFVQNAPVSKIHYIMGFLFFQCFYLFFIKKYNIFIKKKHLIPVIFTVPYRKQKAENMTAPL